MISAAKVAITAKKKQPAKTSKPKGLTVLSEFALTEEEQMKLATKRSLIQTHSSHASGSGADEGTGDIPGVPDVPTYGSNDDQISWKSSEEEDDDEVAMNDDDDNDDDNDDTNNQDDNGQEYDEQDDEEQGDDDEQTNSDNDGDDFVHPNDEEIQDANVEGDKMNEEETNEEAEVDALYRDVHVNLERRDTEMTDALRTIVQTTQVIKDIHVIITLVNPEGQQQSYSMSSGFVSNMLNPSLDTGIDSLFNLNIESTSLVDVSVTTFAEPPLLSAITLPLPPTPLITHLQQTSVPTPPTFNQTNQFAAAVSSIPGIVDAYLANKMHEAVKTAIQLQSKRLIDEAQAENADFINKLDDNIKKIIKDQVKEQTSHAVAANLSELELKKILIDKMESNKSIHKSDEQKNLYKALMMRINEEPSNGSNRGSKRRRAGKELQTTSKPKEKTSKTTGKSTEGSKSHHKTAGESAQVEEPMHTAKDLDEHAHQEFETRVTDDKPNEETSQLPYWFKKPAKPPTPDRDWNKTLPDAHGPVQPWLSSLAQMEDLCESFNELMDTPLDFSAFVMNRIKVDTLTPELLAGPTFELMKGSCKSLVELEYFFEEVYKATTDQLDWNNPEGQQYPHDLRKPLLLIPNSRGHRVIPFDHFINNDLEYLSGGVLSRKYTTSMMKTKSADYGHIKWIEDLVPNINRESARDVYSKCIIIAVTKLQIVEWHNYKHLDWITVRRDDNKLYKFKEDDFSRIHIQDIEDMLLLLVQCKLTNLTVEERLAFNVSLRMFTRSVVIQRRVEDLQLGVEKQRQEDRLMRIAELHKFNDSTLNDVQTALDDRLKGIQMKYLPRTIWKQSDRDKARAMIQAIGKQLKTRRIMRSLEKFVGGRPYEGDFRLRQRTI
ncbi:hypothetical protein Tco_0060817 [Tanacetum coccineum]